MNCPVCDQVRMREMEKDGVLIDVCPNCKGVWLDRGELEKLMQGVREVREDYNQWYYGDDDYKKSHPEYQSDKHDKHYSDHPGQYGSHNKHGKYPYKKKKSVLDVFGDLFD